MRFRLDTYNAHVADWIYLQGRELEADFGQAALFLETLDPHAGSFSFRTFSDSPYTRKPGFDPLERAIHGSLQTRWDELIDLNRRGASIAVTINRTNGHGRAERDIERVRALFLDDDYPPEQVERFPLVPHIQIRSSPGRYHHYWLVDDLPLADFSCFQQRLVNRYGGDHRVAALNMAMQLPGVWRRKRLASPRLPSIIKIHASRPYGAAELQTGLLDV